MTSLTRPIAFIAALLLATGLVPATEWHVSPSGEDTNSGAASAMLRTISEGARRAQPGDTVTVHAGLYRERVNPPRGGTSDKERITYRAAPGEQAIITGAERVTGWEKVTNDTWKVTLPSSFFGNFNPFSEIIEGEWCEPTGRHSGMVYLNGEWFPESLSLEPTLKPAAKAALWFAKVQQANTIIWAQFPGVNPNDAFVEINKRQTVFYPSQRGVNYITVRGFSLRQAATPWAGAMSEQVGLVGTHWSKGWIIESNDISYSLCTGVTLGRYELPKDKMPPATAPGFVKSVELALQDGWSKEKIGSHVVRNNRIAHCEKNGIHGSLGACFSEVSGNEIHDIAVRRWVRGADTGGIKFLGGIDIKIQGNHIYRCGEVAGIWLDWMAQGALVTGNLLHDNYASHGDIFLEMQHGPLVVANNILISRGDSFLINSKGIAFAHNLITGRLRPYVYDERKTPFHLPHSTEIAGLYDAPGGDHRFYNNLFATRANTAGFDLSRLPCVAFGNVFAQGAQALKFDTNALVLPAYDAAPKLVERDGAWWLTLSVERSWLEKKRPLVDTPLLGKAKIPNCAYENPDGSPLKISTDYFGHNREATNPFPGPFESIKDGRQEFKVWPVK